MERETAGTRTFFPAKHILIIYSHLLLSIYVALKVYKKKLPVNKILQELLLIIKILNSLSKHHNFFFNCATEGKKHTTMSTDVEETKAAEACDEEECKSGWLKYNFHSWWSVGTIFSALSLGAWFCVFSSFAAFSIASMFCSFSILSITSSFSILSINSSFSILCNGQSFCFMGQNLVAAA